MNTSYGPFFHEVNNLKQFLMFGSRYFLFLKIGMKFFVTMSDKVRDDIL